MDNPHVLQGSHQWPRRPGVFLRNRPGDAPHGGTREAVLGRWGLISGLARPSGRARIPTQTTHLARIETIEQSATFGNAWRNAQHCIIPVQVLYRPGSRSRGAAGTTLARADGAPMGIAGLWDRWCDHSGRWQESYAMLTALRPHPASDGEGMPRAAERMALLLPESEYGAWLGAGPDRRHDHLQPYPSGLLAIGLIRSARSSVG